MMYDYNYLNEKAKPYGGINKIFNELSDYAEEFIIGYLEAKCGCKVSKEIFDIQVVDTLTAFNKLL